MHPSEDRLLAFLDEELAEAERAEVEGHLRACEACAGDMESLRSASRRLAAALERLDVPPPDADSATIRERAGVVDLPARSAARSRIPEGQDLPGRAERPRRSLLTAAAVVLLAVTGAAAAIPGSPLRDWLADSARAVAGLFSGDGGPTAAVDQEAMDATLRLPSGVAVEPEGGRVSISLRDPSPEVVVRVRLVDQARVAVLAPDARYRTGPGRIEILDAAPGEVLIEIPRSASWAAVDVDGRVVVRKDGADLTFLAPADTSGSEIFFRPRG